MPSTRRKSPLSTGKKKSLSSTSVRSAMKHKKNKTGKSSGDSDGSYLQVGSGHATISANQTDLSHQATSSTAPDTNQAILTVLNRLEAANQDLSRRMARIEQQGNKNSTPLASPRHRDTVNFNLPPGPSDRMGESSPMVHPRVNTLPSHTATREGISDAQNRPVLQQSAWNRGLSSDVASQHQDPMEVSREAIMPSVTTVRNIPSISSAVSRLLAQYEDQTRQEVIPGKDPHRRKSGRYNTTETTTVKPDLRWPNEGYVATSQNRKPAYDDLTIAQWASGQLNNALQIQDNTVLRQVLTQVTLALTDAVSLPWVAVRAAWAASMTQVEEGRLSWANETQWSLNRIGASQVAVLNGQSVTNQQKVRVCKYYNEGTCVQDGNHGSYRHICSACFRNGRSLQHPEVKCTVKSNKQQNTSAR